MPGDPKEYRAHAQRCAELASEAKDPQLEKTFSELARCWAKLAIELEKAQTFRDDLRVHPQKGVVAKRVGRIAQRIARSVWDGRRMNDAKARACREQALKYAEMARAAATPALKQMFTELAGGWNLLANEIERVSVKGHDRTND